MVKTIFFIIFKTFSVAGNRSIDYLPQYIVTIVREFSMNSMMESKSYWRGKSSVEDET